MRRVKERYGLAWSRVIDVGQGRVREGEVWLGMVAKKLILPEYSMY